MASKSLRKPFRFTCQLPELLADTSHLSAESFGALMRLRMSYWRSGPIKDDAKTLVRISGVQIAEWAKVRGDIESFFEISGETWTCWTTHQDMEESYRAISANRKKTEAARLAKLMKRIESNSDRGSNSLCDRGSESVCNNVLTGSVHSDRLGKPAKPLENPALARQELVDSDGEIEALVSAVESAFGGSKS